MTSAVNGEQKPTDKAAVTQPHPQFDRAGIRAI
jgi:hypothetical protein